MTQILIYFFLAIGLSMDAFSLALAYGTNSLKFSKILFTSFCVGVFHYFMPYLGSTIGTIFIEHFPLNTNLLVSLIFFLLAFEMFLNRNETTNNLITNYLSIVFFAFTVSIDSFALGITNSSIFQAATIFSLVSAMFTFCGLILGKKLFEKYGKKATYLGIFILLFLAIKYLI